MRKLSHSSLMTLLIFAAAAPSSTANVVVNSGFETGTLSSWTVSGTNSSAGENGIFYGVDAMDAHTGTFGGYFGPVGGVMNLTQALATSAGATYTISFWLAQPATPTPYVNSFSVAFAGATLVAETALPASAFTQYTFTGTGLAGVSDLTFRFRNDTGFFSLDDISVDPGISPVVPEPGTFLPLAAGLLYLAILKYPRGEKSSSTSFEC